MTKMHEVLGVNTDEVFLIPHFPDWKFKLNKSGAILWRGLRWSDDASWIEVVDASIYYHAIVDSIVKIRESVSRLDIQRMIQYYKGKSQELIDSLDGMVYELRRAIVEDEYKDYQDAIRILQKELLNVPE